MPSGTASVTSSTALRPPNARDTLSSSSSGAPKAGRGALSTAIGSRIGDARLRVRLRAGAAARRAMMRSRTFQ